MLVFLSVCILFKGNIMKIKLQTTFLVSETTQLESTEPEATKHKLLKTNIEEMAEESSPAKKAKFDDIEGSQQPLNGMIKVEEKEKKCWNCDEIGHLQKECKEPQKEVEGADCDVCKIFVKKIHVQYHYEGVRHAKNVKRATGPPQEKKDCTICNITLIGEAEYNTHLEGKKHKKKVESQNKSENQSKFQCELCNVEMVGEEQYNAHLEGKKHKKKVESPNKSENQSKFQCELCNVEIMGEEQYNKHLEGKKHKKKLETPNKSENQTKFQCELCNVEILGEDQYNKHLEGKKHKKMLESPNKSQNQSKFQCELCNVEIIGEGQYNMHLAGKKHQKNLLNKTGTQVPTQHFRCEICNVEVQNEGQYSSHLEGKKHKKKVENPNQSYENNVQSKFQCEFCNVTICGEAQYNAHLVGKKHQKKVIGNSLGSIRNNQVPMMQGQYGQQQPGTQFVPSQIPGF